ncbi:MAG TPA: hypothetical protein EYN87_01820 [Gammaproteobacteria bacterium]|nr:hypothetical protein [Gammaproteobacteria bacterium]
MKVAAANSVEELESFELDATGKPGEDVVRAYERDGVVCLRGAFSDDWIEQGRRAIAAVIRTRSYSDQHATHQKKTPFCGNGFLHFENLHLNHLLLHLPKR